MKNIEKVMSITEASKRWVIAKQFILAKKFINELRTKRPEFPLYEKTDAYACDDDEY